MAKTSAFRDALRSLTGIARRQSVALAKLEALQQETGQFLEKYGQAAAVFADIGMARVDVTTAIYKFRKAMEGLPASLGGQKIRPLVKVLYDNLEKVRVDIYNPGKGEFHLEQDLADLQDSYRNLGSVLAEITAES